MVVIVSKMQNKFSMQEFKVTELQIKSPNWTKLNKLQHQLLHKMSFLMCRLQLQILK